MKVLWLPWRSFFPTLAKVWLKYGRNFLHDEHISCIWLTAELVDPGNMKYIYKIITYFIGPLLYVFSLLCVRLSVPPDLLINYE